MTDILINVLLCFAVVWVAAITYFGLRMCQLISQVMDEDDGSAP